jgi:hypothetical protein
LPPPWSDTHDADGDGKEEVFVEVTRGAREHLQRCIAVFRISDSGAVDRVDGKKFALGAIPPGREKAWRKPRYCELDAAPAPENSVASPAAD